MNPSASCISARTRAISRFRSMTSGSPVYFARYAAPSRSLPRPMKPSLVVLLRNGPKKTFPTSIFIRLFVAVSAMRLPSGPFSLTRSTQTERHSSFRPIPRSADATHGDAANTAAAERTVPHGILMSFFSFPQYFPCMLFIGILPNRAESRNSAE